jgi:Uma2 family endonuclease
MATTTQKPASIRRYSNCADWWHDLGDVPLERIIFDPLPDTATEADFIRLNDGDEKRPCELIDGTLVEKVVGSWESIIAIRISTAISNFTRGKRLGWVTGEQGPARTAKTRVRMPDVSFFLADQFADGKIPKKPIPAISPAFVVEGLSRGNSKLEIKQKKKEYFSAGTRLMWIVNPKRHTVAVFDCDSTKPTEVLAAGDVLTGDDILPGFNMPVNELFTDAF